MTGSGTSTSPYIVSTYGELVQAASQANKYIEFPKEPGTINIEEEYGKSEPPALVIGAGTTINGNNWTIHGLWSRDHDCITSNADNNNARYINDLNFSSFHSQSNWFINSKGSENQDALRFNNCVFSGICEKNFMYGGTTEWFKGCSVNIQFTSLTPSILFYFYSYYGNRIKAVSDCNIKLKSKGKLTLFYLSGNYYSPTIQDCLFNLESENLNIFNYSTSDTAISGCMLIGGSQSAIDIGNGTPQTVNVFDESAFPNAVRSTKFVGVPHDKIGDAAYLSSLGFPIGV